MHFFALIGLVGGFRILFLELFRLGVVWDIGISSAWLARFE